MKKITLYIIAIVAAVAMTSCKGFLEKAPRTSQSTELTLSTFDGLNKSTLGAYSYLASAGWYGGVKVLTSEMRSGNGKKSLDHTSNRYTVELNWNCTADANLDVSTIWAYGYLTISRANNVIDNLEGKESAEVSSQDLKNLKAECLFLRALSHFDIVTLFAQPYTRTNCKDTLGCPYIYHTDAGDQSPRLGVKTVYNNIVKDLLEAEKIIDPAYKRSGIADQKAVVSLEAIQALLSRVYLYMGDWKNSADYATKVIESGKFKMWTAEEYPDVWGNDCGSGEVIFEIYKDGNNYSNLDCMYMTNPDGAYGDCLCSDELFNLYADGDVRKAMYTLDSDFREGQYWTRKYPGKGINPGTDANNTIILRLSEMYLNRAEAALNGSLKNYDYPADIKVITSNRRAETYSSVGLADIKNERRKELAWEGHYFYDKARWNESIARTPDSFLNEANANIDWDSYRWALPIDKRELEVNHSLIQNPGF